MRGLNVVTGLLFSLLAYGAVSSVQVRDSARQQGVVTFRVSDPKQCTLTVYQDAALSIKMDDTNNAIFSGSENCNRTYNIISGNQVTAVLGRRTSEKALDGRLHSRSLQVATPYYVVIKDLVDNSTGQATFATANIPWGDTHVEMPPFSPDGFNHWAYPDLDWSDAGLNKWYIDPLSGLAFKRTPRQVWNQSGVDGKHVQSENQFYGAFDVRGGKWTNVSNATSNSTSGPFASYSGTAQDPLFLPFFWTGDWAFSPWRQDKDTPTVEDVRANFYGYAADTGNVEDRKLLVCLVTRYSLSNDQCTSPEGEVTLPATAGTVQFPSGSGFPQFQFAGWNIGRALSQLDMTSWEVGYFNIVNSVATPTDPTNNGTLPVFAAPGMKFYIDNNGPYTIGTITDGKHFTLAESNVNISNAHCTMTTFGIRVRKKTATNNQINLAVTYSYAQGTSIKLPANAEPDFCSPLTFTITYAADGVTPLNPTKQGRLCYQGQFEFLLADDGETRYISVLRHPDASGGGNGPSMPVGAWSETDPYTFWASHADDSAPGTSHKSIYAVTYDPNTCHFAAWPGDNYDLFSSQPPDCVNWVNKTPHSQGKSVNDQLSASSLTANPLWTGTQTNDISAFGIFGLKTARGNYAVFDYSPVGQNGPCMEAIFELTNFTLVKAVDSMTGSIPGMRWGGCHGTLGVLPSSNGLGFWNATPLSYGGGPLMGPYMLKGVIAKSFDGATWTTDTSLGPNDAGVCPSSTGLGKECVWVKISDDRPCNVASNGGWDVTKWPCAWNSSFGGVPGDMRIDVNDIFQKGADSGYSPSFSTKSDKLKVLAKTPDGSGNYIILAQRWATCDNPTGDYNDPVRPAAHGYTHIDNPETKVNGWNAMMVISDGCSGNSFYLSLTDGATWHSDNTDVTLSTHWVHGIGPTPGSISEDSGSNNLTGVMPGAAGHAPQHWRNSMSSAFNGIVRAASDTEVEAYQSYGNWSAVTEQQRSLTWNFHHLNPGLGSGSEYEVDLWHHNYTLVGSQYSTYKMDVHEDTLDFKSRPVNVFSTWGAYKDISGPGSVIDDTKPWTYCRAYAAGECRPDSQQNDLYVSSPFANVARNSCVVNFSAYHAPCATPLWSHGGWIVETDGQRTDELGTHFRRLTMGLSGPAMQYQFAAPYMVADGKFMFTRAYWPGGIRNDTLLWRMPPPVGEDSVDRSTFVPVPVQVSGGYARIRFGYVENGAADQYYCTSRQEACVTDGKVSPFAFVTSDNPSSPADCRTGCTITIPALSGRIVYYRVEKSPDGSTGWVSGTLHVQAVK